MIILIIKLIRKKPRPFSGNYGTICGPILPFWNANLLPVERIRLESIWSTSDILSSTISATVAPILAMSLWENFVIPIREWDKFLRRKLRSKRGEIRMFSATRTLLKIVLNGPCPMSTPWRSICTLISINWANKLLLPISPIGPTRISILGPLNNYNFDFLYNLFIYGRGN